MVVQSNEAGRPDGIYELPHTVADLRSHFLRCRIWHVRQTAALRSLYRSWVHLAGSDHLEQHLDEVFLFWAAGVVLAKPDLLEEAAVQAEGWTGFVMGERMLLAD